MISIVMRSSKGSKQSGPLNRQAQAHAGPRCAAKRLLGLTAARRMLGIGAAALVLALPAQAESQLVVGAGNAVSRLDFKIVVPRVLFLAVGTGSAGAVSNPAIDSVSFDYTGNAAAVGTGSPAASITNNVLSVRVMGNNGSISITSSNAGPLNNGVAGDTIAWSQITAASSDLTNFPTPAPSGATVSVAVSSGKVTSRTATWTYGYANAAAVPPGTYGGIGGAQNSRLTYTASMP